ncbi:NAD(P)H-binding protein [Sphingomonas sp. 1P06PA]|uniref:NAD(P)H-binding protein n=1 Tax=Sphingomonas sp. 1P06PA TaxID=554121 RepID=UPI0039A6B96D
MDCPTRRRVLLLGATGTIGRATAAALVAAGHDTVCLVRQRSAEVPGLPARCAVQVADLTDVGSILRDGLRGEPFDAVISCLASRTGAPADAWAIDHGANLAALRAAEEGGVGQFILLSAICVQKPRLAFQHAKLAFEAALIASGIRHAIVRPTAFFKSLSGQVDRVTRGKPYLLFSDGRLTACKPIADADLARYLVDCIDNEARLGRILPIGGPGPAITPRDQGEALYALLGRQPKFRSVPVGLLDAIIAGLSLAGRLAPRLAAKAELARIGRYYATESMLVLDPVSGTYDADATPETGSAKLLDHYAGLIRGEVIDDAGDHAVLRRGRSA